MSVPAALQTRLPQLGFVGVGWIGHQRMVSLSSSGVAAVAAIAEPSPSRARAAAAMAPGASLVATLDELLMADIDGVVIASPSGLHAEQTMRSLERGVPVFCQKPLARTGDEARQVIAAAEAADRLLQVDFCYRHLAAVEVVRRIVQNGELGSIFAVDAVFHNAFGPGQPWARDARLSGGGCLMDLGVHLIDLTMLILQCPKLECTSSQRWRRGTRLRPAARDLEDYAQVSYRAGDAAVTLACSWESPIGCGCQFRLTVSGTDGGVSLENVSGSFFDFQAWRFRRADRELLASPPDHWGGRAAVAWATRLRADRRFDAHAFRFVDVADAIDQAYAS